MQDAKGLFDAREPDVKWTEKDRDGNKVTVLAWDEEELQSWPQVRVPMRSVKVIRRTERSILRGNQAQTQVEVVEWHRSHQMVGEIDAQDEQDCGQKIADQLLLRGIFVTHQRMRDNGCGNHRDGMQDK